MIVTASITQPVEVKSTVKLLPVPPEVATLVPLAPYVEPPLAIVTVAGAPTATVISTEHSVPVPPEVTTAVPVVYPVPALEMVTEVTAPTSGVSSVSVAVIRLVGSSKITAASKDVASYDRTSPFLPEEKVTSVPATTLAGAEANLMYWSAPRSATITSKSFPQIPGVLAAHFHVGVVCSILDS